MRGPCEEKGEDGPPGAAVCRTVSASSQSQVEPPAQSLVRPWTSPLGKGGKSQSPPGAGPRGLCWFRGPELDGGCGWGCGAGGGCGKGHQRRRGGEHAHTECQKGAAGSGRGTKTMREGCTPGGRGWRAWAATSVIRPALPEQGQRDSCSITFITASWGRGRANAAPVTPRNYLFPSLTPDQVPSFENVLKTIR